MAFGRKEMKAVLTLNAQFTHCQQKHNYEVLVKPIKSLGLEAFISDNIENLPAVSQILNINTKEILRKDGMIELSPGNYYDKDTIGQDKAEGRLSVWRGYSITVTTYNKKLFIQVDPCSRVLRDESFLQTLEEERKKISLEEIKIKYQNHPVLRKYGNPKIYKIEDIDYHQTPKSKFYDNKEGKEITYLDYYKKNYGVNIKNPNQPLIKVLADKKFNKKNEEKKYIFLIPEMVALTGLTDEQRSNFKIMKSLGEFTKLTANKRMSETRALLNHIKGDEDIMYDINDKPKALHGFKLSAPHIFLGKNRQAYVDRGSIKLKERVYDPYEFNDFVFCYSVGQDPQNDIADADEAFDLLKAAAKTFGIKFG